MRKIMRKIAPALMLLGAIKLNAQTFTSIPTINRSNFVTVPTTPEAAKFQRYTDVPVNISSGIPDIRIPVFAFELKDFNWNIDLSYHAGGNKVADIAGYTGLGWTLNYGGMISAKMIGKFDLLTGNASNTLRRDLDVFATGQSGIPATCTYSNQTDIAIAELASDGFNTNYLPDIYYLNTNHFNTKFFLNADNELSTMPASDIKINYSVSGGSETNILWSVKDENGNKYFFEKMGSNSINMGWCGGTPTAPTFIYYLTRIETFQGESLTFNYTSLDYNYQTTDYEVKYVLPPYPNTSPCKTWASGPTGEGSLPQSRSCPVYGGVHERLIQSITCSNGTSATFTYSARNDLTAGQKLDKIEVYNNATGVNTLKKTILLNYSYFGSGTNPDDLRLKLENVRNKAINEEKYLTYTFEYNPTQLPNRLAKGIDWGGFYNGHVNTSLIPPAASRNSSLESTKACVLEKIIYPTGGYTEYNYELQSLVGGLRVANIKTYDKVTDKPIVKSYTYATPLMDGYQLFEDYRAYFMYRQGDNSFSQLVDCYAYKYTSQPSSGGMYGEANVGYAMVTEYLGENGRNGKVEYFFSTSDDLMNQFDFAYTGSPMKKKITYAYNATTASFATKLIEEFKYKLVKDDVATYYANSSLAREKRTWGTPVTYVHDELSSSGFGDSYCVPKLFFAGRVRLISAPLILEQETKTQYENGQSSSDVAVYSYGANYESLKPVKISYSNSKGLQTVHKLYYTNYLPNFGNYPVSAAEIAAYAELLTNNRINQIGIDKEVDNKLVAKKLTTYYPGGLPYRELLFENGSVLSSEVKATRYDGSNITQLEDSRNPVQSFVWDYNKLFTIAKVNNAPTDQIAYTSFEAGGNGSWYIGNPALIFTSDGLTGNKSYAINGALARFSLDPAQTYTVSIWTKNGIPNYNGFNGATQVIADNNNWTVGPIVNNWTYREKKFTGVTTINIGGGGGLVDEVRLYPANAQMTTYAYDPLMGLTSQCDVNNRISFFEYDGFGRLLRVRDDANNIVKQFEYQYQVPVPNGVVWQPTGATRCKPCAVNPAYTAGLQREEINTNPNLTVPPRWVDMGIGGNCGLPDWQNTGTTRCVQWAGGNTGTIEVLQKNMNPCSATAFQFSWELGGTDLDACPLPPYTCDYSNCLFQGEGFKCVNNFCEFGAKVYFLSNSYPDGTWLCFYRYEWSDGSWSSEYTEISSSDCMHP